MKIRIVSPGWETFTGQMGWGAVFEDGVSVGEIIPRVINRLGASLQIVNAETGEQLGPSANAVNVHDHDAPVAAELETHTEIEQGQADERERLAKEAEERKAAEAVALEAARAKAAADAAGVVYSRQELEAIGANDGIDGLRQVAEPLGVKGRSIAELVNAVLDAQAKKAAE